MGYCLTYKPFGECSILVEWEAVISIEILNDILKFKTLIRDENIKSIVQLKSAYNSLLIQYSIININFENEVILLESLYKKLRNDNDKVSVLWKIPVCYDVIFGIDLEEISTVKKLSKKAIIEKHTEAVYTVFFIGFLPGFLYLGGLNKALFVARKASPRLKITKGAVAIGGNQTGVYPSESPGGWNVIGNSPVEFFNARLDPPCFAKPGDKLMFQSISLKKHKAIKALVQAGAYHIENEVFYG